jgi:uncharacterized protein YjbJ (UPF0337 family)
MHSDVEVLWKQLHDQMKEWWGKLTDDDLDVIGGKRDQLVGKLEERYGWAKRDAEDEVTRRFAISRRGHTQSGGRD